LRGISAGDHLIYLTDVQGVLDGDKILPAVACDEIGELVQRKIVSAAWCSNSKPQNAQSKGRSRSAHRWRHDSGWPACCRSPAESGLRVFAAKFRHRVMREPVPVVASAAFSPHNAQTKDKAVAASVSRASRRRSTSKPVRRAAVLSDAERFLLPTYKRSSTVFTHGRGAFVFDSSGKKYLDFSAHRRKCAGHAHPRIIKTIRRESARAIHFCNLFHNEFQGPLARKLVQWSGLDRVFFANSARKLSTGH